METCAFDISSECLVTDLVHELSSSLEIPFLLSEDIKAVTKQENPSPLDNKFYEDYLKEEWTNESYLNFFNSSRKNSVKNEFSDVQNFLDNEEIVRTHSTSGSGSGSGSDCSSTEIWLTKNELDTPPITPPDERISSENVFLLNSDELRFIPICGEDATDLNKINSKIINGNKKIRIQAKPVSTTLNIFEPQSPKVHTVMCNVFSEINSNNIKTETFELINSKTEIKKSVLSKKDLELLQAKRKHERMIRNRESAYLSRKRKKEHVAHLEKQVQDLMTENNQLRLENRSLRQRLAKYEELEPSSTGKKPHNIFSESPRKTTAVLALLVMVCLNFGSFSSFLHEKKDKSSEGDMNSNFASVYSNEMRHTRTLLWTAPEPEGLNSTFTNWTKTSCPLFINQTESIRLESELRRWIGDEDYYRPKHNISKISQYFYSGDKPSRRKNMSKRKRNGVLNNRKKSLEMDMYHMKANLLNFDTFFEAIHRRDDTFYLVSFSSDHLLLPALSHNQTSRPKMSLMLPAFLSNGTGADHVEMMQIDCEVTNTQYLSVNENDIPSHMRRYSNSTSRPKNLTETRSEKFEEFFEKYPEAITTSTKLQYKPKIDSSQNQYKYSSETFKLIRYPTQDNFTVKQYGSLWEKFPSSQTDKKDFEEITEGGKNLLKLLMVGPIVKANSNTSTFLNSTKYSFN